MDALKQAWAFFATQLDWAQFDWARLSWNPQSSWESCAVALALAYPILAARENILCWYCAFFSTAIYTALLWRVSLPMQSGLNVYYMGMAVYGWYQWRHGGRQRHGVKIRALASVGAIQNTGASAGASAPQSATLRATQRHLLILVPVLLISALSGYLLDRHTETAWPYIDAFTTWASVVTTWMMAKKILENWLYWLLIDSICIPLYINRGLHQTALLFTVYLFISIYGYLTWRRLHQQQQNAV